MSSLSSASAASYYRPPVHTKPGRQSGYSPQHDYHDAAEPATQKAQQGYANYSETLPTTQQQPGPLPSEQALNTQPSPFASVSQQHAQQKISMGSILQDVDSTMDALGVPDGIRQRVHKYMATIEDQATHDNPSKRHVHESMKVIGNILDGFITDALKQPSNVVREWVDALLLQPIDYHDPQLKARIVSPSAQSSEQTQQRVLPKATPQQHQQWRDMIKASKSALNYGQADEAASQLLQLVGELETHEETTLLANTLTGLAKAYKHTGQTAAADTALQTASQLYQQLGEPHKAVLQWRNLAQLYIEHGQPNNASSAFEQGSVQSKSLLANAPTRRYTDLLKQTATLHNDWASHLYTQQQYGQAKQQLKTARQLALQPKGPKNLLPDIYSNMAHVFSAQGQGEKAERALLQSMKAAQKLGNDASYQASWQQLQQLYASHA